MGHDRELDGNFNVNIFYAACAFPDCIFELVLAPVLKLVLLIALVLALALELFVLAKVGLPMLPLDP